MRLSMWTYPWDVQDLGVETVARDIRNRAGLNGVSLAAAYHAGRFLQPRSSRRKVYFPEDGTIYFQPELSRWRRSRLKPKIASILANGDALRSLVEARDRTGLSVSTWTVCLHNSRLGGLHPGVATRNAFGDVNPLSLCPSHPDAREYACALVEDLSANYRPDAIELEAAGFMPYAHGFHHEKDGVGLTAEDDFLMSLCFCPACMAGAAKAGVDGEAARRATLRIVAEALERPAPRPRWPGFAARGLTALNDVPELLNYARWRCEPVTSLVADIRARAAPESQVYALVDFRDGWLGGYDTAALAKVCDGLIACAYDMSAAETAAAMAAARQAAGAAAYVGAGFRVFWPEMAGPDDLGAKFAAAIAGGAVGANFYNYGLIPAARLDWIREATTTARR